MCTHVNIRVCMIVSKCTCVYGDGVRESECVYVCLCVYICVYIYVCMSVCGTCECMCVWKGAAVLPHYTCFD